MSSAPTLFDENPEEHPGLRPLTRAEWQTALIEEMKANPPIPSCRGEGEAVDKRRKQYAVQDLTRLYVAVANFLGGELQIVAAPEGHQHERPVMLLDAYTRQLAQRPPFPSLAGDTRAADRIRRNVAERDIARFYAALDRLHATLRLVGTGEAGR